MAKVIFETGDIFTFNDGGSAGVVIGENDTILITGEGRTGYDIKAGVIPSGALLTNLEKLNFAFQMAIRGVLVMQAANTVSRIVTTVREERPIRFKFEGVDYVLPMSASHAHEITLPDGRVLSVDGWLESLPPIPDGLKVIGKARGVFAQKA